ncbi:CopM family metallochaperone [Rhizobium terrae]|uniref:CopM family metallochaperone n=1 Tax=Rhizobium terrae TaxID=2171756 RepID=UPI001D0038DB|nr:DUF305 domain-containing protein [Rhizobium terrae]
MIMLHPAAILIASALSLAIAGPAATPLAAQQMKGHDHSNMPKADAAGTSSAGTPAASGYIAANEKMHKDMAISYSGDADVDFVRSMIPHHQGAIDMAKVELEHGKDPEIRKLAEAVIKAQEAEIAEMQAWLKARGK